MSAVSVAGGTTLLGTAVGAGDAIVVGDGVLVGSTIGVLVGTAVAGRGLAIASVGRDVAGSVVAAMRVGCTDVSGVPTAVAVI
jgi:hypothetical protein